MAFDLASRFDHAAAWPHGEEEEHPLVIGIAGGSGSGKTTIVQSVVDIVGPEFVIQLPHDAYYRVQDHLTYEERTEINYDHPDSLENELMIEHISALRSGRSVDRPVYDFGTHTRSPETLRVEPQAVIIVDGILVLADPELRELMDLRIYIDTDADLRLMRRLQRDIVERGRTVDSVLNQYEKTVRPMHLQFVEPSKRYADIIVPEGYNPGAIGTVTSMIRHFMTERNAPV
ncbi:MAG: uridine kinase [Acidimicrobiia bacterium]|jgi:uridine kinase